jgi:nicotinate-nucleotide adenylyltransferase
MGGTFDPIHLGHLRAAELAWEAARLDVVAFVPAGLPPHRDGVVSSALDRYAMVALATAGNPHFLPSDVEIARDGPSYTVDTVRLFATSHPGAEIVLVVGSDSFLEMPTWRDSELLLTLCRIVVVPRPDAGPAHVPLADPYAGRVDFVCGSALPISSTMVRSAARDGQSLRYLVPDAVADHIAKRGLYR